MATEDEIIKIAAEALKAALISKLLSDPLLPPIHKIKLMSKLKDTTPSANHPTINQIKLNDGFQKAITDCVEELGELLPKHFSYGLTTKVEEAISEISRDLLLTEKMARKTRINISLKLLKGMRRIIQAAKAYENISINESQQQFVALQEQQHTLKALLELVKAGKLKPNDAYEAINTLIIDEVLLEKPLDAFIEAEQQEEDTNKVIDELLTDLDQHREGIKALSGKWFNMLPLTEEAIEEEYLKELDQATVQDFLKLEAEYRKQTFEQRLELLRKQVDLQEQEEQRWRHLIDLQYLIADNPEARIALRRIMATLRKDK